MGRYLVRRVVGAVVVVLVLGVLWRVAAAFGLTL